LIEKKAPTISFKRDMKKSVLATLLFAFVATAVFAQAPAQKAATTQSAPKTVEQRADDITAGMVKNLRLSPKQAAELKDVNRNNMKFAEEARKKHRDNPRKLAEQMDIISQTRLSQIKDILTEQQFAQYQSRREEKMGVPREARSNPSQGPGQQYDNN
jgi:Spy/CpxP family protein refolding chaperone